MSLKKRLLSSACAAVLTLSLSVPALAYSDVPQTAWYYQDVQTVTEKGLMTGGTGGAFFPEAYVNRATVLTTLWRLSGSPEVAGDAFPDVPKGNWAYSAAIWARSVGITTGYSNGNLGPSDDVTREQLAVFLYRYALSQNTPIAEGVVDLYTDAQYISPWALTGMKHALGSGLMKGTGVELSPLGYASRASLATILVRLTTPVKG